MFCPNCGKEIINTGEFCEYCGKKTGLGGESGVESEKQSRAVSGSPAQAVEDARRFVKRWLLPAAIPLILAVAGVFLALNPHLIQAVGLFGDAGEAYLGVWARSDNQSDRISIQRDGETFLLQNKGGEGLRGSLQGGRLVARPAGESEDVIFAYDRKTGIMTVSYGDTSIRMRRLDVESAGNARVPVNPGTPSAIAGTKNAGPEEKAAFRLEMEGRAAAIDDQWTQVDQLLLRRGALIPDLVDTAKSYAEQEAEVFVNLDKARGQLLAAKGVAAKAQAAGLFEAALSRLLAMAENYPRLKADPQFLRLMEELTETENRLALERKRYNDLVREYNAKMKGFPAAREMGLTEKGFFEIPATGKTIPKVDFD